jgi:hypothetical protein
MKARSRDNACTSESQRQRANKLRTIDRVCFEVFEIAKGQRGFVRGFEDDFWRVAGVERFLPAWGAEAPPVAGLEAGEAPLKVGRREVVADRLGER